MAGPERPSVLLVMSDEHAPQFAGFHGHPLVQTPHLDRLAGGGTVFADAICNSPLCVPSRASFMAGLHLHRIGNPNGRGGTAAHLCGRRGRCRQGRGAPADGRDWRVTTATGAAASCGGVASRSNS
jgi:arylsulfatase A-like enzyme